MVAWFGVFGATLFAVNDFSNEFLQFQLINVILQGYHGNLVTREQVLLNADMVAAAAIKEPVPEREAATFEAVPEAPVEVVAAAVREAVAETAPVEAEAVAQEPTPIEAISEAVPEADAAESGPSKGKVPSETTVSDVTAEVVAVETVTEFDPIASEAK